MNSEFKNVLFIINKFAGTKYRRELEEDILYACGQEAAACDLEYREAPGHATQIAAAAVDHGRYELVVAVGGDGTVNEVAQGLLHSSLVMGIIPKGSGNGLARHLKIPMSSRVSVQSLFHSRVISMDTFMINGRLSLNVSGIGFDGHIANLFSIGRKRGFTAYARHVFNEFGSFSEFEARISYFKRTEERRAFIIAIANSSQYGNNARIAPAASICDQLLHISILNKVPFFRWDVFYEIFRGRIDQSDYCETITTNELEIHLPHSIPFHIDGEAGGASDHFSIKLDPASLKILIPKKLQNP